MERLQFKATINAPREKVWETLWGDETYSAWTSAFAEGSRAVTDWKKGSRVLFVDGKGDGMVSRVADSIPNEFMSFEHLGMIMDGVEDISSPKVKEWAGAMENYTLKSADNRTELLIDIDIAESHKDYFLEAWPKALDKLKELAEKN